MVVGITILTNAIKGAGCIGTDRLQIFFQIDEFAAVEPQGFEK